MWLFLFENIFLFFKGFLKFFDKQRKIKKRFFREVDNNGHKKI
jgi:hypothetical protein